MNIQEYKKHFSCFPKVQINYLQVAITPNLIVGFTWTSRFEVFTSNTNSECVDAVHQAIRTSKKGIQITGFNHFSILNYVPKIW